MSLEEFNKLCDDTLEEYRVELPITLNQVDKYLTSILLGLVSSLKGFSNSEKVYLILVKYIGFVERCLNVT